MTDRQLLQTIQEIMNSLENEEAYDAIGEVMTENDYPINGFLYASKDPTGEVDKGVTK